MILIKEILMSEQTKSVAPSPRLSQLRQWMQREGYSLYICTDHNPHLQEYSEPHWSVRTYLSGFDGSNGTLFVGLEEAHLVSDSRYTLQAKKQLPHEIIFVEYPQGNPYAFVEELCPPKGKVAIDLHTISFASYRMINAWATSCGRHVVHASLPDDIWHNRPAQRIAKPFAIPATRPFDHAINHIQQWLEEQACDTLLITSPETIGWLTALRGLEIETSPVVRAFMAISTQGVMLFMDHAPSSAPCPTRPYDDWATYCTELSAAATMIAVDIEAMNALTILRLQECRARLASLRPPLAEIQAQYNAPEIEHTRQAHLTDGVALVNAWYELTQSDYHINGNRADEVSISNLLTRHRSLAPDYICDSFDTIVGWASNGAIVHYHAIESEAATLGNDSLLLIDSGAHYHCGTTDITRTIAIGTPSEAMKRNFTLVLKGHIALAQAHFPTGTTGHQLDVLARQHLWHAGLNFGHGTGHGVGYVTHVHEGPQGIRPQHNPTPLRPGMLVSNEPGIYLEGQYGIRCENLMFVVESPHEGFLMWEPITLFPFDHTLIDATLLERNEIAWLNNYHRKVYDTLSPHLAPAQQRWLKAQTNPIISQ